MVRGSNCLAQFYKKARTRKGEFCKPLRRKTLECASFLSTHDTSEQSPLCFDAFLCNGHKKASFARFLAPPFQNRSRSLRLFACKRALDASRSLPTCFGYGSSIPAGGIFQISFFNEIRLLVSEILLRNMKYAMRMKYLLRKGSSSYCKLTEIFLL